MTHQTEQTPLKQAGLAHLFSAAGYSAGGLTRLAKEAAFRQEVVAGAGLLAAYAIMDVTAAIRLSAAVLFLLLIAMEAVNTVSRPKCPILASMPRISALSPSSV